ncbi:MAG: hypothetical protein ACR2H1_08425 [Limisphaerales bacterium]
MTSSMKSDNNEQSIEEKVLKALSEKAIIWDRGEMKAVDTKGSHSSVPCKNAFEGEIFLGEISGCRLIVDRIEFQGKVAFHSSIITKKGQIILNGSTGELMWCQATKYWH